MKSVRGSASSFSQVSWPVPKRSQPASVTWGGFPVLDGDTVISNLEPGTNRVTS